MHLQVDDNPPFGKSFQIFDILDDLVDSEKYSRIDATLQNECVSFCFKRVQGCDNAICTVNHPQPYMYQSFIRRYIDCIRNVHFFCKCW